jgi:hypothetical protein
MEEKLYPKQTVNLREVIISEIIQSDALVNLLEKKSISSKKELLEEMKRVQATLKTANG